MHTFDEHYPFTIGEDYYYSVFDISLGKHNRPHKHEHVKQGISDYTSNWELIETKNERRRGSDTLFLAEDTYYISCSRTGMEKAGNSLFFSKNTPERLRYSVICSIFEGVLERESIEIKDGVNKHKIQPDQLNILGPRSLILRRECSEEEIMQYYDELADLLVETISKYNEADAIDAIEQIVEEHKEKETKLYRSYTNFSPTTLSKTLPIVKEHEKWEYTKEIKENVHFAIIYYEQRPSDSTFLTIEIENDDYIALIVDNIYQDTYTIKKDTYETQNELETLLKEYMEHTIDKVDIPTEALSD